MFRNLATPLFALINRRKSKLEHIFLMYTTTMTIKIIFNYLTSNSSGEQVQFLMIDILLYILLVMQKESHESALFSPLHSLNCLWSLSPLASLWEHRLPPPCTCLPYPLSLAVNAFPCHRHYSTFFGHDVFHSACELKIYRNAFCSSRLGFIHTVQRP